MLYMEKEVVRVWFCNRRQKEKRVSPNSLECLDHLLGNPQQCNEKEARLTYSYRIPQQTN